MIERGLTRGILVECIPIGSITLAFHQVFGLALPTVFVAMPCLTMGRNVRDLVSMEPVGVVPSSQRFRQKQTLMENAHSGSMVALAPTG